jgi:hypothetical protein
MQIQNLKKISAFTGMIFLMTLLFLPVFTYSAPSTDTANKKTGITYECMDSKGVIGNCDFNDVLSAFKKVADFAAEITLSLSVIVIAWAGFKYMSSGGNPGERTKANQMLVKVAKGIAFILAAWLIVTLIMNALTDPEKITPLLK